MVTHGKAEEEKAAIVGNILEEFLPDATTTQEEAKRRKRPKFISTLVPAASVRWCRIRTAFLQVTTASNLHGSRFDREKTRG